MSSSPFDVTASAFKYAPQFRLRTSRIARLPHVDGLVSETRKWFGALRDEEGGYGRDLRIQVWRLRTAVLYGLVAFDDPALDVRAITQAIVNRGEHFPSLRERCAPLSDLVDALVSDPRNPKRDAVRTELESNAVDGKKVGFIVALARNHLPAYTSDLIEDFQTLGKGIQFVASRRHLLASTFDHIVVPFGTRQCALANEILCGYRAPTATVIAYHSEAMAPRGGIRLPCAISVPDRPEDVDDLDESSPDLDDSPDREVFWSAIKHAEAGEGGDAGNTDTAYTLPARGILLANGAHVFLRDDSKAIEISDLIEGRQSLDNLKKRLPRTTVRRLQTGDLIVLRVQGSGEYLVEVADELMRKDGKARLRGSAIDWKPMLKDVLTKYGSRWLLQQLEKRDFHLANHSYIWKWTTGEVIGPQKESLFCEIIAILDDCGTAFGESDVLEAAKRRWEEMKELKHYHQKAGRQIRGSLLSRLRTIIDSRPKIGSEYELQIPGVSAGTLAIVRIAAVDTEVVSIPYHRAGVVHYNRTEVSD